MFCELQEEKKKKTMNSYYTIKESHPPTASQIQREKKKKTFSIGGFAPPESLSTSTPTHEPRWARPKTDHQALTNFIESFKAGTIIKTEARPAWKHANMNILRTA